MKFPQLPQDSKGELPSATDKMSQHRGTLAWWVISCLGIAFTGLLTLVNQNYRAQIHDCQQENQEFKRILIPQLNQLEDKLKKVDEKADSLINQTETQTK